MLKFSEITFFERIKKEEVILFTKHLSTMYRAGITITEALQTLIEQTRSLPFKKVLTHVLADVDNGKSLAIALAKHSKVFDQFYVSLVKISEESGTLDENLEFLAKQLAKDNNLRKKVKAAMLYPLIVLSLMVTVGGAISVFVLPKLVDFFESFDVELPLSTQILLFISKTVRDYGFLIFLSICLSLILLKVLLTFPRIKFVWHTMLLKFPIFGQLVTYNQVARFSRNFGTLVKSGVPIEISMEITAHTLSNLKFEKDLLLISAALNRGVNIGKTMNDKKYWEFPLIVSKMISVGEKSGKIDETLLYLADFYDDEIDGISQNLASILEPILLIIIGLLVGFVALSIISPIYQLTGSIRR